MAVLASAERQTADRIARAADAAARSRAGVILEELRRPRGAQREWPHLEPADDDPAEATEHPHPPRSGTAVATVSPNSEGPLDDRTATASPATRCAEHSRLGSDANPPPKSCQTLARGPGAVPPPRPSHKPVVASDFAAPGRTRLRLSPARPPPGVPTVGVDAAAAQSSAVRLVTSSPPLEPGWEELPLRRRRRGTARGSPASGEVGRSAIRPQVVVALSPPSASSRSQRQHEEPLHKATVRQLTTNSAMEQSL